MKLGVHQINKAAYYGPRISLYGKLQVCVPLTLRGKVSPQVQRVEEDNFVSATVDLPKMTLAQRLRFANKLKTCGIKVSA